MKYKITLLLSEELENSDFTNLWNEKYSSNGSLEISGSGLIREIAFTSDLGGQNEEFSEKSEIYTLNKFVSDLLRKFPNIIRATNTTQEV